MSEEKKDNMTEPVSEAEETQKTEQIQEIEETQETEQAVPEENQEAEQAEPEQKPETEEPQKAKKPKKIRKRRRRSVLNLMTIREVKRTFGRHFAIFAIIALGVGFFSGLRITSPVLVNSMNRFYQKAQFYDYKLISSIGWDEDSEKTLNEQKDVRAAQGAYQEDVLVDNPKGDLLVYKTYSITTKVNKVKLKKGKLPKEANECLMDARFHEGFKVGDTITFSEENKKETLKAFTGREFKITGFADSPLYTNFERGTTSIGNGSVTGFIYLRKEAYTGDAYTEMYVKLDDNSKILSDSYEKYMDKKRSSWEDTTQETAQARADRLRDEAQARVDAAKKQVKAKKAEIKKQLGGEKKKLDAARAELDATVSQLENTERDLDSREQQLDQMEDQLKETKQKLDSSVGEVTAQEQAANKYAQDVKKAIEAGTMSGDAAKKAKAKASSMQAQAAAAKEKYNQSKAQYENQLAQYNDGRAAVSSGRARIASAAGALDKSYSEYDKNLAKYSRAEGEMNKAVSAAEAKVAKAQKQLDKISTPQTYVLERNTNIAYSCFESDSQIVRQVAGVFPLFFILVAALVCITTMSRMVEEQRGQIGILKGMGYKKSKITNGFMLYSGSAAVFGCIIGYVIGILLFPTVIWRAYRIMYISVPLRYMFNTTLFFIVFAVALFCSLGTSWLACRGALHESAASLLRPKAPKIGKRILLEHIPFIWNHMRFMRKVSLRNIFRYKKRLFMMVVGIGGCTALLLTGFGLKDSIAGFATSQFDNIQIADAEVTFQNGKEAEVPAELRAEINKIGGRDLTFVKESWDLMRGKKVKSVDLIAPCGQDSISHYFILRDTHDKALALPGENEALISISLAKRYDLKKGDEITLRNEDMKKIKVKIKGIFENHVYNYVIVSPDTLRAVLKEVNVNSLYLNFPKESNIYKSQASLAALDDVTSVTLYQDFRDRLTKMMSALNYIVLLIIICAAALAFIVAYNLTNINIIERNREIATIKVLGFTRSETSDYVLRENLLLTAMGAVVGIFLGIRLHRFVMSKIVIDLVYFPVRIKLLSYLLAVVLTFVFTALVNLFMSLRMEKINMAESLKAVE